MAYAGAALAIMGTVVNALGNYQAGKAQEAAYKYNAAAESAAANANASQIKQQTERRTAEADAAFAAAGVEPQGTPTAVASDLAQQGELSRQLTLYSGRVRSEADTFAARQASRAATIGLFGSLLSGTGSAIMGMPQGGAPATPSTVGTYGTSPGGGTTYTPGGASFDTGGY